MVTNIHHHYDEKFLNQPTKIFYVAIAMFALMGIYGIYQQLRYSWVFIAIAIAIFLINWYPSSTRKRRLNYILTTPLPRELWRNRELHALNLSLNQQTIVEDALRDFFILHALAPKKPLAMPSQTIDKLWHAFILDTQRYQDYCQKAFGKVFHHIPDYQFSDRSRNIEMFTWQMACRIQGISPANPLTLPRLFAADKLLAGVTVGSFLWDSYQTQMAMLYRQWHAQTFSSSGTDSGSGDITSHYDDSCNVGLTDSGDCSCGGSDSGGSSCGGGCGGGGGGD